MPGHHWSDIGLELSQGHEVLGLKLSCLFGHLGSVIRTKTKDDLVAGIGINGLPKPDR